MVVPTSSATVAIATFITELSSVIRNCPAASVINTVEAACATAAPVLLLIAASKARWPSAADRSRLHLRSPHPTQVKAFPAAGQHGPPRPPAPDRTSPVGAGNPVTSRDLHVLAYEATEPILSQRPNRRSGGRGSAASSSVRSPSRRRTRRHRGRRSRVMPRC